LRDLLLSSDLWSIKFAKNVTAGLVLLALVLLVFAGGVRATKHALLGDIGDPMQIVIDGERQSIGLRLGNRTLKTVPSAAGWIDSGIDVSTGDTLTFEATGRVNVGFPTYVSFLDHQSTLCGWDIKAAYDQGACRAWRVLDWVARFQAGPHRLLAPEEGGRWSVDPKYVGKPSSMLECLCRKEHAEQVLGLGCAAAYPRTANTPPGSENSPAASGCDTGAGWQARAWTSHDIQFFSDNLKEMSCAESVEGRPPPQITHRASLSEVLALTDSCLKTWLLRGHVYDKYGRFSFAGPGGERHEAYSVAQQDFPSRPQPGQLYPNYQEDGGMLCGDLPHGVLVARIAPLGVRIEEGTTFPRDECIEVGPGTTEVAKLNGRLWLAVNDASAYRAQNIGDFFVAVQVDSPPWYLFK
jgi:hypothetical protein